MAHVLVVDDYASVAFALRVVLELEGHTVRTAGDGAAALVELDQHPCELLVSDVAMPIMDGLALTVAARQRYPTLFIIVISSDSLHAAALDAGANLFIAKPFDANQLRQAVTKLLTTPPD